MSWELSGKRVCLTRSKKQSQRLADLLRARGAEILELPLIEVLPTADRKVFDEILEQPGVYDWIVFTSGNGVRIFFDELFRKCGDIRSIAFARIACVGQATADAVAEYFLRVDLLPEDANATSLGEAMVATGSLDSARVLVVAGNRNRSDLRMILEDEGHAIVDVAEVYETKSVDLAGSPEATAFREKGADAILFTSASTVEAFVSQAGTFRIEAGARVPKAFSIGTMTSEALAAAGIPLTAEAAEANLESLVGAVVEKLT